MFLDRCRLLREALRLPAITTDVIVGFPGETEVEFQETLATCRDAGFSKIHAFPFSQRKGTPAAEMDDQIPKQTRTERMQRLVHLGVELRENYYRSLIGLPEQLLVESSESLDDGSSLLRGTTARYAPAEMRLSGATPKAGDLVDVQVRSSEGDQLVVA